MRTRKLLLSKKSISTSRQNDKMRARMPSVLRSLTNKPKIITRLVTERPQNCAMQRFFQIKLCVDTITKHVLYLLSSKQANNQAITSRSMLQEQQNSQRLEPQLSAKRLQVYGHGIEHKMLSRTFLHPSNIKNHVLPSNRTYLNWIRKKKFVI